MIVEFNIVVRTLLILLGIGCMCVPTIQAQAPAKVKWHVIASGGAVNVSSGQFRISSTIGQTAIGKISTGQYKHIIGFWGFKGITDKVVSGTDNDNGTMGNNALLYNYPNPFAYQTTINFIVPQSSTISIRVIDMVGREVRTLINNEFREVGDHMVTWDAKDDSGSDLGAGNYICEMSLTSAGDNMKTRIPMMLVK